MWLFHYKTNPSFKWKYPQDISNNYFHINNRSFTYSLLSSTVELRKNRCFQKLHNDFFCNTAILNDMKGWKFLVSLRAVFCAPTCLPINFVKKHIVYTSFFHLNDYQIQILKKDKLKRVLAYKPPNLISIICCRPTGKHKFDKRKKKRPHFRFLRWNVIILRGICSNSLFFFLELVELPLFYSI